MKRPVFWAVAAFALGEVEGLCLDRISQISIVCTMLICAVIFYVRKNRLALYWWIVVAGMAGGMINVAIGVPAAEMINVTQDAADSDSEQDRLADCEQNKIVDHERTIKNRGKDSVEEYQQILQSGETLWIEGVVESIAPGENLRVVVRLNKTVIPRHSVNVLIYNAPEDIVTGDMIRVKGIIDRPEDASNPGGFQANKYYLARNICGVMYSPMEWEKYEEYNEEGNLYLRIRYGIRDRIYRMRMTLSDLLHRMTDDETAGIYGGILLGLRSGVSDEIQSLYQMAGISHILAISGLHMSMIGLALFRLLRKVGVGYVGSSVPSLVLLLVYGEMTGWGFATLRAVIMLVIVLWGGCLGRKTDLLTGGSFALLVMLLQNPYRILDGGFLLSFTAILGVTAGQYIMKRMNAFSGIKRLRKKRRRCYSFFSSIIMSCSLQLVMAPILMYLYYVIPLYSCVVNLIILPMLPVVMVAGLIGLAVGAVNISLGSTCLSFGRYILHLYREICTFLVKLPGNSINTGKPEVYVVIIFYMFLLVMLVLSHPHIQRALREGIYRRTHRWFDRRYWITFMSVIYLLVGIFGSCLVYRLHCDSFCEQVTFLDVGQGDAILIRTPDRVNIVIDGGSATENNLGKNVLAPALKAFGMADVDYWFVSHADTDHISGLMDIMEEGVLSGVRIRHLVISAHTVEDENLAEILVCAESQGIEILYMEQGSVLSDSEREHFLIRCLHPDSEYRAADKNQASLCLEYQSEDFCMLFTGDMDADALEYMFEQEINRQDKRYDVIKIPHHGSRYSYIEDLYDMADYAVISCGRNNVYGHPHEEVVDGIAEAGVILLRTDEMGAVEIKKKNKKIVVSGYAGQEKSK